MDNGILTVSQLNRYIAFKFKEDNRLKSKLVCGEISNLAYHAKTGMVFFTLKDSESSIKAVMFREYVAKLDFKLEDGMSVIVIASTEVFERDGIYQLYVKGVRMSGEGAIHIALEQLKEKLAAEGLFDAERKKSVPAYPNKIGIVTAKDGAAIKDILATLERRYPVAEAVVFPTMVQGEAAVSQICSAIRQADSSGCDVIILARGGGSTEELDCFNAESIARTVASCYTPLISAVGHEKHTPIVDYVADLRASTPTAAAELAVPDKNNLLNMLQSTGVLLYNYTLRGISEYEARLALMSARLSGMNADRKLETAEKELQGCEYKLNMLTKKAILEKTALLGQKADALEHLNPLSVLLRGYAAVYKDDKIVSSASGVQVGEDIKIKLGKGELSAKITEIGE